MGQIELVPKLLTGTPSCYILLETRSFFTMEHPLVGDLSEMTIEQLQGKITELNKRISFAYRSGNQALMGQLQLVLTSYNTEYQRKMAKLMPKGDDDKYGDKIDIS